MSGGAILLGDIGGTNARFALLRDGKHEHAATLKVAAHATAIEAINSYLDDLQNPLSFGGAALACAGPVKDGTVRLTNSAWRLDAEEIEAHFGFPRALLINDFAAQAWALPHLRDDDLRRLGGGSARADAPCVVLGPGTGLGIATYLPPPSGPAAIVGEGGHVTLAANTEREAAVLAVLRERFGHVSAERVLSGEGLVHLYEALAALENRAAPHRTAAEITEAARSGNCKDSKATLDLFCGMLGSLAGNLALTLGAHGGVFIAGGIAPRIADDLAASRFRDSFEAKGRFKSYLAEIPTSVVLHPTPAVLGLAQLWAAHEEAL